MVNGIQIFGAFLLFIAIAIVLSVWRGNRRASQMAAMAGQLGYQYRVDGYDLLAEGLGQVPLFSLSPVSGKVLNVLTAAAGDLPVTVCDYVYSTGASPSNQRTYAQTVACFRMPGLQSFTLHPASEEPPHFVAASAAMLAGLGEKFSGDPRWEMLQGTIQRLGQQGTKFGSYILRGAESFQPLVGETLEQNAAAHLSIESAGGWLAIFRAHHKVKPADLPDFIERATALARLFRL